MSPANPLLRTGADGRPPSERLSSGGGSRRKRRPVRSRSAHSHPLPFPHPAPWPALASLGSKLEFHGGTFLRLYLPGGGSSILSTGLLISLLCLYAGAEAPVPAQERVKIYSELEKSC